jgi:hypothetical protein
MTARCATIDFSRVQQVELHTSGNVIDMGDAKDLRPRGPDGKLMTPKQIRARARRRGEKAKRKGRQGKAGAIMTPDELAAMYKPLEDWDLEELARGRPRAQDGTFRGRSTGWINRETHEEAMKRFKEVVKTELNVHGVALANPNDALALPSQGGKNDNSTEDTPAYSVAHFPGHTIPMGPKDDEPLDVEFFEEGELDDAAS